MKIVDIIREYGKDIFKIEDIYTIDSNIKKLKMNRILTSIPDDDSLSRINIDINDAIFRIIRNESSQVIQKEIYNILSGSKDIRFIDFTKHQHLDKESKYYEIFKKNFLHESTSYKNILTNGMIVSSMEYSSEFKRSEISSGLSSVNFYNIGEYRGFNIWINPYQRYSDSTMMIFNDIRINIGYSGVSTIDREKGDTSTKICFEFELGIEIDNPKIINIIEDEKSINYQVFLERKRDEKINEILFHQ